MSGTTVFVAVLVAAVSVDAVHVWRQVGEIRNEEVAARG